MQRLSQRTIIGESGIDQRLVEANGCAPIHFVVLPVSAVYPDDAGLVTVGVGIRARSTEGFGPISGEPLDMPGMETVAERMADYFIGHYPAMPGLGKTLQALGATRRLEDSTHAFHDTKSSLPRQTRSRSAFSQVTPCGPVDVASNNSARRESGWKIGAACNGSNASRFALMAREWDR